MEQGTSANGAIAAPAQVRLCECGCGRPTRIARMTITRARVVKGQPMRFIVGHNSRGVPRARLPEITQMVKLCECGCGNPVPIARETNRKVGHIKGQPVRFIRGHSGVALVARLAAEARRAQPGPEPKPCECGCGESAPIATKNRPDLGHVKGQRMRFISGHSSVEAMRRLRVRPGQVMQFVKLCACGCGYPTRIASQSYAPYSAVKGQPLEFIQGHRLSGKGCKRKLFVETGQRFGAVVVIDPETVYLAPSGTSYRGTRLLCDCGAEFVRTIAHVLRSPGTQSCGNCAGADDFTGRRFERLTVGPVGTERDDGPGRQVAVPVRLRE